MAEKRDRKKHPRPAGQYYLMEKIAQGGMAEIFKGLSYDVHGIKKTVCIKKILPHLAADQEFIASLIDEAKLAVKLVQGNIAQTYDLGKVGDDYFMVMEYVDGRSLSQIHKRCMSRGELIPIPYLVYFAAEILGGLDYMHRRTDEEGHPLHIVHRDISPQNIMVSYSGTVKIIDFGIAKAAVKVGSTDSGILKGKFAYMSPEQAYGEATDHRSDIFSLGIILHEMLTGRRLFKVEDSRQTIRNVRRAKVEAPSTFREELPEELDRISMCALAKDRRMRYPTASEMRNKLIKLLHTIYPEFRPSDAAEFVQKLFQDEMGRPSPEEADAKTPYLIIDRSNSALADESQFEATGVARAPVDLREYMLEETTGEGEEAAEEARAEAAMPPPVEVAREKAPPLWKRIPPISRRALGIGLAIFVAAAVAVAITLKRAARPPTGVALAEVMVVTNPPDARVHLDGRFIGQGSPVTARNISADESHILAVEREGYTSHERRIVPKAGELMSLRVTLTRVVPQHANLELITNPPKARVYIDDLETSYQTPVTIENLKAGRKYTIGLYLKGYRFWTKPVTLKGDETRSFDIQLMRDYGSVSITSNPSKALVIIDGLPVGQTPLVRNDLEPDKVYRIEVWHEGYESESKEIKATAGRTEKIDITLERKPTAERPQ
jgi:serine/threonine protein kinase